MRSEPHGQVALCGSDTARQEKTSEVAGSTVQYSTLMSSKEGEDMSQVNHSFGDGPLVLFSGLFLLATFVGELGKRQGEYKHKKQQL